jgi:hypothetical protein
MDDRTPWKVVDVLGLRRRGLEKLTFPAENRHFLRAFRRGYPHRYPSTFLLGGFESLDGSFSPESASIGQVIRAAHFRSLDTKTQNRMA